MSVMSAGSTGPLGSTGPVALGALERTEGLTRGARHTRVRHLVRESLALVAFSAATSLGATGGLVLLASLGR